MNRRNFLTRLFTGLVATKLAFELGASKPEAVEIAQPKPQTTGAVWRVNPAWVEAEYEIEVRATDDGDHQAIMHPAGKVLREDPFPLRFNLVDGKWVPVEPYIAC